VGFDSVQPGNDEKNLTPQDLSHFESYEKDIFLLALTGAASFFWLL
jgi:hypothetical protein